MSKGDLLQLDESTELMKISADKYRYVNKSFSKPAVKLSDHNADIKLKVGNEYFKAHRDVLSGASDYFSAMFSHNMAEKGKDYIEIRDISVGGFRVMLEYFYHGHITLENESVEHCLEASRFFQVDWLTGVCCNFLTRHISVSNCLYILHLADTFSLEELAEDMYNFIGTNAMRLMEEEKVAQLSYTVLKKLLSGVYFIDASEEMVLKMIIDWANSAFEDRKCHLEELLSMVKFHLMSPEELDNIPDALSGYDTISKAIKMAREIWQMPHRWSILKDIDITTRGAREVLVLISQWDTDRVQFADLHHPYLHQEPFGLLDMGSVVDFVSIATLGNFLYGAGGYDLKLHPINTVHMFDPRLRMWIPVCPMMQSRENFVLLSTENKLYALGGCTQGCMESSLHEESQASSETPETAGGPVEAEEPGFSSDMTTDILSRDSGSSVGTVCLRSCECYNPDTDSWSSIPALPYGVYAHAACYLNGTIFVTGGVTDNLSETVPVSYCYAWKQGDDGWTRKASMITRRQSHAMFAYQDKIYVMGGYTAGDLEDLTLGMKNCTKNECYNPVTDTWAELCDTPDSFGHIHRTVAIMDDTAYLLGGSYSSKYLHEFNLTSLELVEGAFCGKDFVKLCKLSVAYPRHMPNDVQPADDVESNAAIEERSTPEP